MMPERAGRPARRQASAASTPAVVLVVAGLLASALLASVVLLVISGLISLLLAFDAALQRARAAVDALRGKLLR
jgi:hypothetical protein